MCRWVVCISPDRRLFQDARVVRDSISVNLMELKGPRHWHTHTFASTHTSLQTILIHLGSILCIWGTQEYSGIGFRKYPYLIVCVSLCLYSNPVCVLTCLPCMADFIKPDSLIDQQILLLSFCCMSCFHGDASISVVCAVVWISLQKDVQYLFFKRGR